MTHAQILVVEDEAIVAKGIQLELESMGYSVPLTASSGEEAIQKAGGTHPDLVLMDIVLKGEMDGIEAAKQIRHRFDIPVVYLTAYEDDRTLGRAKVTEPFGYLLKPFEEKDLHTTIEMALYKHRMEQKLKATERWLAATLQSIADAVIATDARLHIRLINPSAEALTGWRQVDGGAAELSEIVKTAAGESADTLPTLAGRAIQRGTTSALPAGALLLTRDGRELPVEGSIGPIFDESGNLAGLVLVFRDISERKRLERVQQQIQEQQRHAQKMEAVSTLAGGIAHDFSNLLTAVLGNTSLARAQLPAAHPGAEFLAVAEAAAERAAKRVAQLLEFSRQNYLKLQSVNLSDWLPTLEPDARQSLPSRTVVALQLAPDLWEVQADPSQLRELLLNVCHHAKEAMPGGGRLTLQTENVSVAREQAPPENRPGEYVRFRVRHAGPQVQADDHLKLFEPAAPSTKTGSTRAAGAARPGLALISGIAEQHHGWVECPAQTAGGDCLDVYLPRYCPQPLTPPSPAPPTRARGNSTKTILLADDEPFLRRLGQTILQNEGYQVLLAEDGVEAVEIFARERYLIDLVILDLTMPRLSGKDACLKMLDIDPGVRILFSSGYFAEELTTADDRILGFIKKPYRHQELIETVKSALEQAGVPKRDLLLMLVKRLEQALAAGLAGREASWAERVALVLERVQQMMRQQAANGEELAANSTVPSQARYAAVLRREYAAFLDQAASLERQLQGLVPGLSARPGDDRSAAQAELSAVGDKLHRFVDALAKHRQEEINLVLESVTTDIGGEA